MFKRRNVYARFKGNIWNVDLAEMNSLPSFNHGIYDVSYMFSPNMLELKL